MSLQWVVALVAIAALVIVAISDATGGKSKHSSYFEAIQQPKGKQQREANIPDPSKHDSFYAKLNSR